MKNRKQEEKEFNKIENVEPRKWCKMLRKNKIYNRTYRKPQKKVFKIRCKWCNNNNEAAATWKQRQRWF